MEITFRDSDEAFQDAIDAGVLSLDPCSHRYVGDYMYMHTLGPVDSFKHRDTRKYIASVNPSFVH